MSANNLSNFFLQAHLHNRTLRIIVLLVSMVCFWIDSQGQVKVTGGFISDSLKIGEETRFFLSARYPADAMIIFPDSTYDFFPFEFQRKQYFPTETVEGVSTDSAVYYLTTFEVDENLGLALPAYLTTESDSSEYLSNSDTIRVRQLVTAKLDSVAIDKLRLLQATEYHNVNMEFNWFVLFIVVGILLLISLVLWIFFGKQIVRYFKARNLARRHSEFLDVYNRTVQQVQRAFSPNETERALTVWKKYMEQLESHPYTKLTSREMLAIHRDEMLGRNLKEIDRAIYGHANTVVEPLWHLKTVADQHYYRKLQEVKNGK
jgi:hypothetical protein